MKTPFKTYERGRFVCEISTIDDSPKPFVLEVSDKNRGCSFGQNFFETHEAVMHYLEETYFEDARNEAKPYRIEVVDLDHSRWWKDDCCIPEVDGGWVDYFDTLEEAIECVKEIREGDEYADAHIVGDCVPREYEFFEFPYTF